MPDEIDIDKIIRRVSKKLEEEENRGIGGMNGPDGSEISDATRAQQKAAYEAGEDKRDDKTDLEKFLDKAQKTGQLQRTSKESGVMAFRTLDEAMAALKKIKESGGDGMLVGVGEDQQQDFDLTPAEEKEFYKLMDDLKTFCIKHDLPAAVQIQQARMGNAIAMSGFRNLAKTRTCGRMILFNRILDILFEDGLDEDDYNALVALTIKIMMHQRGAK